MSPTGDLLFTSIFAGEVSSWACSGAFMCSAGMALSQWQHTLWGNRKLGKECNSKRCGQCKFEAEGHVSKQEQRCVARDKLSWASISSQRSLHSAPIFRLSLKVAVNGTHQCDFHNFWGALCSNCHRQEVDLSRALKDRWRQEHKEKSRMCLVEAG